MTRGQPWSGKGLLPVNTRYFYELVLIYRQSATWIFLGIHLSAFWQEIFSTSMTEICFKISHLSWPAHFPCEWVNSLRPRQNGRHFTDDVFKCIFLNENVWISPKISLMLVPKVRHNNISALGQIMAWHRSGDKPLSEPMIVSLLTYICVTRPQWVNMHSCITHNSWDKKTMVDLICF